MFGSFCFYPCYASICCERYMLTIYCSGYNWVYDTGSPSRQDPDWYKKLLFVGVTTKIRFSQPFFIHLTSQEKVISACSVSHSFLRQLAYLFISLVKPLNNIAQQKTNWLKVTVGLQLYCSQCWLYSNHVQTRGAL